MIKYTLPFRLLFLMIILFLLPACQSAVSSTAQATAVPAAATTKPTAVPPSPTAPPTNTPVAAETVQPTPAVEPTAEPGPTATNTPAPTVSGTYSLDPELSEVRFIIDELLLGNPNTVVGSTNQIAGEIELDWQNPQDAAVGPIQINARDLATDDEFRNRALRRQILDSAQDEYQFITFTPTAVEGLSSTAVVIGETYQFKLTGELQIRDIVQSETFEMTVTAVSESELSGSGETVVLRSDYGLQIPSVPGVANVSEEVKLEIEFTAVKS